MTVVCKGDGTHEDPQSREGGRCSSPPASQEILPPGPGQEACSRCCTESSPREPCPCLRVPPSGKPRQLPAFEDACFCTWARGLHLQTPFLLLDWGPHYHLGTTVRLNICHFWACGLGQGPKGRVWTEDRAPSSQLSGTLRTWGEDTHSPLPRHCDGGCANRPWADNKGFSAKGICPDAAKCLGWLPRILF